MLCRGKTIQEVDKSNAASNDSQLLSVLKSNKHHRSNHSLATMELEVHAPAATLVTGQVSWVARYAVQYGEHFQFPSTNRVELIIGIF